MTAIIKYLIEGSEDNCEAMSKVNKETEENRYEMTWKSGTNKGGHTSNLKEFQRRANETSRRNLQTK